MTTINYPDVANGIHEARLQNSALALHSSLRSFGYVEGGPETVVKAFLDAGCTLVVPTFTYECALMRPVRDIAQNGWNVKEESLGEPDDYSPEWNNITKDMGAIPASILKLPHRVRGRHPIDSFTAVGPYSREIIDRQAFLNIFGPYKWLSEYSPSFLVLVGVDFTSATPIHFAEERAGRRLFRRWGKYEGRIVETELGGCSDGFERLRRSVQGIEKTVRVGPSLWRVYPFQEFVEQIAAAITANPEITRCGNTECVRCLDAVRGGPI